jgi:hypothetical protein
MSCHNATACICRNVTACAGQLAISSFIQFILHGKLVFSEQVADQQVLFASSDWWKHVTALQVHVQVHCAMPAALQKDLCHKFSSLIFGLNFFCPDFPVRDHA